MPVTLSEWLERIERLHPTSIDMGLERVAVVRDRLKLFPEYPQILVGGTNGKGSTCAMLDAIYRSAGYDTGLYTSPHLLTYNERVKVNQNMARDEELVNAFERIEAARRDISLTYFEFGTLAAQLIFSDRRVEVAVLEVGMGGRLDATNVFDPICSVVTNIGIDHVDYLGHDRESIGREKAGIFRGDGKPAICADEDPPRSLLERAESIGAELYLRGRDFGHSRAASGWNFWSNKGKKAGLPMPSLPGQFQLDNAAAAIECVSVLCPQLPVDMSAIRNGLLSANVPGRLQVLTGSPAIILDVGHNPHAIRALVGELECGPVRGRTLAVFGVLADKDIEEITSLLANQVDCWYVCGLPVRRAATPAQVEKVLSRTSGRSPVHTFQSVAEGLAAARGDAEDDDRILVFGSFYTVSEALKSCNALVPSTKQ